VLFNRVRPDEDVKAISEQAARYFGGTTLASVPESDAVRAARRAGEPLLAHAPGDPAADAFHEAASKLDVRAGDAGAADVADRFRSAVIPDRP
jgi:septum site-determining protein MinD